MATLPDSKLARIEFFENRIAPWTTNVDAIGLTGPQVVNLASLTSAARDAYTAAQEARAASKAATQVFHDAVAAMVGDDDAGSDMIEQIKNHAESTGNPNVYALAQIPAPATPGVAPPPGRCSDFSVALEQNGALVLTWKCTNPTGTSGTSYEVMRRIGASGAFEYLGPAPGKTFTDETLPTSAAGAVGGITYQVTGVRAGLKGSVAQFTVNFGAGGEASVSEVSAPVKLAA